MMDLDELQKVDIFSDLVGPQLRLVAGIVEEKRFDAGHTIFSDGDPADSFLFLVKGKVRISKQIPGVGEEALAILETGDYFGEMALIDDSPRSADAICNTGVVCGVISRRRFEELLFLHKDLAYDLLWTFVRTLSHRLRENNEKMRAFLMMAGKF